MTFQELLPLLAAAVSGVRAKETVGRIAAFHRVQASPGYDAALELVRGDLDEMGIESAVHEFQADGRSRSYEGWVSPPAWTVEAATLRQTEPREVTLGTYEDCPESVVVHSPGGRIDGEVVHVERGTADADYEDRDVRGKIVLANGRAADVIKRASARGAIGVVTYPDSERAAASYDLVQYASIFPRAEEIPSLLPAFSISRRTADRLLKQLRRGAVHLSGEIVASFDEGRDLRVLEAWVPGVDQDRGEVLLVAHLCHPRQSANDNASGSAVLLELAHVFRSLRSRIPLSHTIRFLWVPEFHGTVPWSVANAGALQRVHFVLNLDMVGQSPELIGAPLDIFRVSNGTPSYLDACVRPIARAVAGMGEVVPGNSQRVLHWRMCVPSGGSDHLVFSAAPHELPAMMLGHDDPFWHTSLDTLEKVDATRLKHVAMIAGALAAVPSMIDEASQIPEWLLDYSIDRLSSAYDLAKRGEPARGKRLLELAREIEEVRIESMADLAWSDRRVGDVRGLIETLNVAYNWMASSLPEETPTPLGGGRPIRVTDGPLPYAVTAGFDDEESEFFRRAFGAHHRGPANSLFNLCDGTRTAEELALQLTLDFDSAFSVENVARGIELLAKAGVVEVRSESD